MEDFRVIYRILKYFHDCMDNDEFDKENFNAETFKVSENRFQALLRMLLDAGYITGILFPKATHMTGYKLLDPKLTLEGLTYLEDNSLMKKAASLAKGIIDAIS